MNRERWLVLVLGVAAVSLIGSTQRHEAVAQGDGQGPPGRYEISAWAIPGTESEPFLKTGCFLVDTATGELWELRNNGEGRVWARVTEAPPR